jgi:hypothetical protein
MVLWKSAWNVHVFPFCDPHRFPPSFPTPNCDTKHCTSHTCHRSKHMKTTRFHGNGVRQTQNTSSPVLLCIIYRWLVHGLRLRTKLATYSLTTDSRSFFIHDLQFHFDCWVWRQPSFHATCGVSQLLSARPPPETGLLTGSTPTPSPTHNIPVDWKSHIVYIRISARQCTNPSNHTGKYMYHLL